MHDLGSAQEPTARLPRRHPGLQRRSTTKSDDRSRESPRCKNNPLASTKGAAIPKPCHPDPFSSSRAKSRDLLLPRGPASLTQPFESKMDAFAPRFFDARHFTKNYPEFPSFYPDLSTPNEDAQNFQPTPSATRPQSRRDVACVARGFNPGWAGPPTQSNSQQYPPGRRS